MSSNAQVVEDAQMPQLFQAADAASLDGQRHYIRGVQARLLFICGAALTGVTSWRYGAGRIDLLALARLALFVLTLAIETTLWRQRPEKAWYDGRATAESAKTLAWRYAVGGLPFPIDMGEAEAILGLMNKLDKLRSQFHELELAPVDAPAVSEWMRRQRQTPLDQRREIYLEQRIAGQRHWYAAKAAYNRRRSVQWRLCLVVFESAGILASVAQAVSDFHYSVASVLAASVGVVVAWMETKQHDGLARAYAAAVADLAAADSRLRLAVTEETWATEVDDAEEAISREHTVWLASRSRI